MFGGRKKERPLELELKIPWAADATIIRGDSVDLGSYGVLWWLNEDQTQEFKSALRKAGDSKKIKGVFRIRDAGRNDATTASDS
jgi:hypothetical protein